MSKINPDKFSWSTDPKEIVKQYAAEKKVILPSMLKRVLFFNNHEVGCWYINRTGGTTIVCNINDYECNAGSLDIESIERQLIKVVTDELQNYDCLNVPYIIAKRKCNMLLSEHCACRNEMARIDRELETANTELSTVAAHILADIIILGTKEQNAQVEAALKICVDKVAETTAKAEAHVKAMTCRDTVTIPAETILVNFFALRKDKEISIRNLNGLRDHLNKIISANVYLDVCKDQLVQVINDVSLHMDWDDDTNTITCHHPPTEDTLEKVHNWRLMSMYHLTENEKKDFKEAIRTFKIQ